MEEIIPEYINIALDKLSERGYRAYIIGGAVRDYCLKKEPVDFDITTDASPDEIIDVFKDYSWEEWICLLSKEWNLKN